MQKVRIPVGPHLSRLTVDIWFGEVKLRLRASQGVSVLTTFPSKAAAEDGSNQLFLKDFVLRMCHGELKIHRTCSVKLFLLMNTFVFERETHAVATEAKTRTSKLHP